MTHRTRTRLFLGTAILLSFGLIAGFVLMERHVNGRATVRKGESERDLLPQQEAAHRRIQEQAEKITAYLEIFRQFPLSARGKVIDEEGSAVPGATVHYNSTLANGYGGNKEVTADAQGRFAVAAGNGISLVITAAKQGYYTLSDKSVAIVYPTRSTSRIHDPNPRNFTETDDVNLVLRKILPPSGAIRWTRQVKVDMTKLRRVWYHVSTGAFREGAQGEADVIEFSVVAPESFSFEELGKFTWSLTVRVPGGGLVERSDRALFLAPEAGYMDSTCIVNEKGSSTFSCDEGRDLFVKFSDTRFGMLHFRFDLQDLELSIVEAALGQPGSRNLTP